MFYFDKENPEVMFTDNRELEDTLCDGRKLEVKPDKIMDFRNMEFEDKTFKLVIFDPPHMKSLGKNSWMAKKYGVLGETWREDIKKGFSECFRVLEDDGMLIFKWNETSVKRKDVLKAIGREPLFGHPTNSKATTHWFTFMKIPESSP